MLLRDDYTAEIFRNPSLDDINRWVARKTAGKIDRIRPGQHCRRQRRGRRQWCRGSAPSCPALAEGQGAGKTRTRLMERRWDGAVTIEVAELGAAKEALT